jgi:hypothetical protein
MGLPDRAQALEPASGARKGPSICRAVAVRPKRGSQWDLRAGRVVLHLEPLAGGELAQDLPIWRRGVLSQRFSASRSSKARHRSLAAQ